MNNEKKRSYYENLFADYPDVVNTADVCEMMGGIARATVLALIAGKRLRSFYYLNQEHLIPKEWLIDYLLSEDYQKYKLFLSNQV